MRHTQLINAVMVTRACIIKDKIRIRSKWWPLVTFIGIKKNWTENS